MAVKIRMRRTGATNDPSFRVVATDSRFPRDGRFLETLGWYNPKAEGINVKVDRERMNYWVSKGAQVSDTVRSLLKRADKAGAGTVPAADQPVVEKAAVVEAAVEAQPEA
jgi:small subunit ribosomal protein S16